MAQFFIENEEGQPVAFLKLTAEHISSIDSKVAIISINTHPNHQGKGLATAILKQLSRSLNRLGVDGIYISCFDKNKPMNNIAKKLNFRRLENQTESILNIQKLLKKRHSIDDDECLFEVNEYLFNLEHSNKNKSNIICSGVISVFISTLTGILIYHYKKGKKIRVENEDSDENSVNFFSLSLKCIIYLWFIRPVTLSNISILDYVTNKINLKNRLRKP